MSTREGVVDVSKSLKLFGLVDYLVFASMLVMCSVVGVYFGYKDHQKKEKMKANSTAESGAISYLVGGREMQVFPVAMSLVASGLSGIALLGTPSEVYVYGINIVYVHFPLFIVWIFVYNVIIPVFFELQIVSIYEYLKQRFDNKVRLFGSAIFILNNILWLPIVIYAPALCFNQTTGINVNVISALVCIVCVFYTLLGGIRAVVWTDMIQILLMYGSIAAIIVTGIYDVGGLSVLFERNLNSQRLDPPKLTFDLTERHSAIGLLIGGTIFMTNLFGMGQAVVQRYLTLPTQVAARKALAWNIGGAFVLMTMCNFCGLILYAKYFDCDPLTTKLVNAKDQLLPLFVMETLSKLPGFAGLFVAGIFSASLSTLSTVLNSAAAVVLEDFFKPLSKHPLSERKTAFIMRGTVLILGLISLLLVPVVQNMGGILQLGISIPSASYGPLLGIFFIGFFLPWIKAKGAFIGAIVALAVTMYLALRAQFEQAAGKLSFETMPTSTEGCDYSFEPRNSTVFIPPTSFQFHHISYLYYSFIGILTTIFVAWLVTLLDCDTDPTKVELKLLAPFIRKFVRKNSAVEMEITK